jgi:hypothetical protein
MNKRPLLITIISWIFIAIGSIGFLYHLREFKAHPWSEQGLLLICIVRLLAIVGGIFMLRGFNWARWLVVVWIAFHVILSAFHSLMEVAVHGLLFVVVTFLLFRPQSSAYFRGQN